MNVNPGGGTGSELDLHAFVTGWFVGVGEGEFVRG